MVEINIVPAGLIVAIGAQFRGVFIVRLVFRVTGIAFGWGVTMLFFLRMAVYALGFSVIAQQFEIRKPVIECLFVENDDVGISPFVIGVASTHTHLRGRLANLPW